MPDCRTLHTAELSAAQLAEMRSLLDEAFEGRFDDADFEHALGGMHALAYSGGGLVGHAAVVMRRLLHDGRALRCGYVEAVAVRPGRQREGVGATVMAEAERLTSGGYDLGALSASRRSADFYLGRGWQRWTGTTSVLAPGGLTRTLEEDTGVFVLPGRVRLRLDGDLACDWRDGDVW